MATESPLIHDGSQNQAGANFWNPGAALAGPQGSGQFLAVYISATRTLSICTAATWTPPASGYYGILQNTPALGQACDVGLYGVSKVVMNAACTAGQALMIAAANGALTPFVAGANNWIVGYAIEAAAVQYNVITAYIVPPTRGLT